MDVSPVMGKGFNLAAVPVEEVPTLLLFATGSGIAPIRALLDSERLQACETITEPLSKCISTTVLPCGAAIAGIAVEVPCHPSSGCMCWGSWSDAGFVHHMRHSGLASGSISSLVSMV